MRSLLLAVSWFAFLVGGTTALILWAWGLVPPAGLTGAISATGFLVIGYFRFSDEMDSHRRWVERAQHDSPVIRTDGRDAARLAMSCEYHEPGDRQ